MISTLGPVICILVAAAALRSVPRARGRALLIARLPASAPGVSRRAEPLQNRTAAILDRARDLVQRGNDRVERDLPDALDAVARSLRSGASLRQALGEASRRSPEPLASELRSIRARIEGGQRLESALDEWVHRRPTPSIRLAVAALILAAELGGSGARAVDRLSRSLRERGAVQRELRALSAQAKLSALVIIVAPLAFAALGATVDGRTARFLLSTPAGLACVASALALDAGAAWWMARIVRAVPV